MSAAILPWNTRSGTSGITAKSRSEIARRARNILESEDYEKSLHERIRTSTLPPAVETMLWHYAYGKPADTVNVNIGEQEDLSQLSTEKLKERLSHLSKTLAEVEAVESAIDVSQE